MSKKIRVAIVGVGNCASSLVQGFGYYHDTSDENPIPGVIHHDVGGYKACDIDVVSAYDVDYRKIGLNLTKAIFTNPNCTLQFCKEFPEGFSDPVVQPAPIMDGVSAHMYDYSHDESFRDFRWAYNEGILDDKALSSIERSIGKEKIIADLLSRKVDILINYLPVGSQQATEFWAEICLETGISFLNCIPVFIGSDLSWEKRFIEAGIPMVGDDMRSCVGASIVSAVLQELFQARGADVLMHYQDNIGGNTDFSTMQNPERLKSKKRSKENVITGQIRIAGLPVKPNSIKAGPAAYFPALKDNKRAHWLIKATSWGGAPIEFTADLSVEDSPNSAAVVCDAIRLLKVARELGIVGPLIGPSAATQKTPPVDLPTSFARTECDLLSKRMIPEYYSLDENTGNFVFNPLLLKMGVRN